MSRDREKSNDEGAENLAWNVYHHSYNHDDDDDNAFENCFGSHEQITVRIVYCALKVVFSTWKCHYVNKKDNNLAR